MVRIAGSHPADPGSSPGLGISFASFCLLRMHDHSCHHSCHRPIIRATDHTHSTFHIPHSTIRDLRSPTLTDVPYRIASYRIVSYRVELACVHVFVLLPTNGRSDVHWTSILPSSSPVSDLRSPVGNVGAGCLVMDGALCWRSNPSAVCWEP